MATKAAHKRLTREYAAIAQNPPPYIMAHPNEANILEWHYLVTGAPDTPYHEGQYWGTLVFPPDYPFAPPAIRMHTPNGRFQTSTRLCLSISDFHPKSFNPAWSVSTILLGLQSFMNGNDITAGSISTSEAEKRYHAARSKWWNSTGGGSATGPPDSAGPNKKSGTSAGNIKAGDGGVKFRNEWPDEDKENWTWIQEHRVDIKTGKAIETPKTTANQAPECSPAIAAMRKRLGSIDANKKFAAGSGVQEIGRSWLNRRTAYVFGAIVMLIAIVSRILGHAQEGASSPIAI